MKNLKKLVLTTNYLSGEIPPEIGNMESLEELWLHQNNFTGTIPESIMNLKNLKDLRLMENYLSGTVPESFYNWNFWKSWWGLSITYNRYNFKDLKTGAFWTSAAAILTNYVMAFLFYPLYILVIMYVTPLVSGTYMAVFLSILFRSLFVYSLSFSVFNLLPFYPLDGFRMVDALDEQKGKAYQFLRNYGYYILLGLMLISVLANRIPIFGYIDILGYILTFATEILGKPITLLWNWLFTFILW